LWHTFILVNFSQGKGAGGIAEESTHSKDKGKKRKAPAAENNVTLKDFTVEYAKSNRSTCRGCEEKIMKVSACMSTCVGTPTQ
jgi:poly [ADP-ribose] polymerase